jgi:hypothetical protein
VAEQAASAQAARGRQLIEFVEWNEDAPPLWRSLVEIQLRYRHDYGLMDRSYTSQGARSFESHLRLVGEDGGLLPEGLAGFPGAG